MVEKGLNVNLTILAGSEDIELLDENGDAIPAYTFWLGELRQGGTTTLGFIAKNIGTLALSLEHQIIGDTSWGKATLTPAGTVPVAREEQVVYTLTLEALESAELGDKSLQVNLSSVSP